MPSLFLSSLRRGLSGAAVHLALLAGFLIFYGLAARQMLDSPVYERDDALFRADTTRALRDITGDRKMDHSHTSGHPNFVIFHAPLGSALRDGLREWNPGLDKRRASRIASAIITSAAAAATVVLFYCLLLAQGLPRLRAVLFSSVLGCSAVQVFYAAIPETYIFSSLGLTAVALAAMRRDRGSIRWQLAALYAWSALTSNIITIGFWSFVRFFGEPWKTVFRKSAVSLAITSLCMVGLSLIQHALYPKSSLFFMPSSVARESGWLSLERLQHFGETTRILLQHQWLSNIVAPEPVQTTVFGQPMGSIEAGTWDMIAPSLPLLLTWGVCLAAALGALGHRAFYRPAVLAALATMAFNFCFFACFGHDRMLYAALWTSTAVFLAAAGVEFTLQQRPSLIPWFTAGLVLLVTGLAWHNLHFPGKLIRLIPD